MLQPLRDRLTYANVVATLALFVALGGSSYAVATISGQDIRDRSIHGRDVAPNTLGRKQIKESRLSTVPRARTAARVGGASESDLRVRCFPGGVPAAGTCFEPQPHSPEVYSTAAGTCAATDRPQTPGRRLPTHGELMTAFGAPGIELAPGGELTDSGPRLSTTPNARFDVVKVIDETGNVAYVPDNPSGAAAFRCVADPLN